MAAWAWRCDRGCELVELEPKLRALSMAAAPAQWSFVKVKMLVWNWLSEPLCSASSQPRVVLSAYYQFIGFACPLSFVILCFPFFPAQAKPSLVPGLSTVLSVELSLPGNGFFLQWDPCRVVPHSGFTDSFGDEVGVLALLPSLLKAFLGNWGGLGYTWWFSGFTSSWAWNPSWWCLGDSMWYQGWRGLNR